MRNYDETTEEVVDDKKDQLQKEIKQFIEDHEDMTVEVSPGVSYNLRDVINDNYRLLNAQFASGDTEPSGFKKIFTRKMWVVYRTLIQGSDLDMKNINIRSTNGVKFNLVAFLRLMFVSYLTRSFFGEMLDKILSEMCWHGSSIVKRFDGTIDTVDFRNYITEANIQNTQERRHMEMLYYTYDRMMSYKEEWADNWQDIMDVWEKMKKAGESQFKVLEFWTWCEIDGKMRKVCVKALDNTLQDKDQLHKPDDWTPYIVLDYFATPYQKRRLSKRMREKLGEYEDMFPYEQFDLFKIAGRFLGLGCGELLKGTQEMYDENFNIKRKMNRKAAQGNYIHTGVIGQNGQITQLTQDFISNLTEGGVVSLYPNETLQPFPVDTRTMDFQQMEEKIYELMRQIMGITAQGTGEEQPASTSATQASINQQVANTVYDFVRERMQHGVKRLFNNGYKQDIINEIDEQEMISIVGDPRQLQEMDNHLIDVAIRDWVVKEHKNTGLLPTVEYIQEQALKIREELRNQGDTRFTDMKKSVLKDMDWMVEFDVTQEAYDAQAKAQALMALKADPTTTKSKAKIEDELLVSQGLNPSDYDPSPEEIKEREAQKQMMLQQELAKQGQMQEMVTAPEPLM